MVVGTASTGFGLGRGGVAKAYLRSQNMLLAVHPMPLLVGTAATEGISPIKQVVIDRHDNNFRGGSSLAYPSCPSTGAKLKKI
jgi:hypothetical protein